MGWVSHPEARQLFQGVRKTWLQLCLKTCVCANVLESFQRKGLVLSKQPVLTENKLCVLFPVWLESLHGASTEEGESGVLSWDALVSGELRLHGVWGCWSGGGGCWEGGDLEDALLLCLGQNANQSAQWAPELVSQTRRQFSAWELFHFIYLFIFGWAGSSLLPGLSLVAGFSSWRLFLLWIMGSRTWVLHLLWLSCSMACGIFLDQG